MLSKATGIVKNISPKVDWPSEAMDPTGRLLRWAHILVINKMHGSLRRESETKGQGAKPEENDSQEQRGPQPGARLGTQHTGQDSDTPIQPLPVSFAFGSTDLQRSFGDGTDLGGENSGQYFSNPIIREEKWIKMALLLVDILADDSSNHVSILTDEIGRRIAVREKHLIGRIPPWGLRFHDHIVGIELAVLGAKQSWNAHDAFEKVHDKLSHFLLSDFSILSSASGITGPSWASDMFTLDSIVACCSLLWLMVQDIQEGK